MTIEEEAIESYKTALARVEEAAWDATDRDAAESAGMQKWAEANPRQAAIVQALMEATGENSNDEL